MTKTLPVLLLLASVAMAHRTAQVARPYHPKRPAWLTLTNVQRISFRSTKAGPQLGRARTRLPPGWARRHPSILKMCLGAGEEGRRPKQNHEIRTISGFPLAGGIGARRRAPELRQQAERLVGACRERLARGDELCREIVEGVAEPAPGSGAHGIVLVAVEEVGGRDLLVDEVADRLAELDPTAVLANFLLRIGEPGEGEPQASQSPIGRIDLRARAGDGNPHRRMGPLVGLGRHAQLQDPVAVLPRRVGRIARMREPRVGGRERIVRALVREALLSRDLGTERVGRHCRQPQRRRQGEARDAREHQEPAEAGA